MIYLTIFLFLCVLGLHIRLTNLETKFYRKHEADVRHRNRETTARSEQISKLRQRVHNEVQKAKRSDNELAERIFNCENSQTTIFYAINELQAKGRKSELS